MSADLEASRAIESLRAGVPGSAAVARLGTTQDEIARSFSGSLSALEQNIGSAPISITANFGDGKSHLLHCLKSDAERRGFVTSMVVVSPEMPMGNAHIVLKAIAEEAVAPGHTGKALMELAANSPFDALPVIRRWADNAPILDRFRALLTVYESTTDEELRMEILSDLEGNPVSVAKIRQALKEIQGASHFDLRAPRNALLAHDRIRLLGKFCQAHGTKGLVVFFDEVERIAQFPFKARLSAYQEIGWWNSLCLEPDSGVFAVFALTTRGIDQCLTEKGDESRIKSSTTLLEVDERDRFAVEGIGLLKRADSNRLVGATPEQFERMQHGVRALYEAAYGIMPQVLPKNPLSITIRSEIRRWITIWDLKRHYPDYVANVSVQDVKLNSDEFDGAELALAEE